MGTRGIIGFYSEQKDKLTYNHFDSYPEGIGVGVLQETREAIEKYGLEKLRATIKKVEMVENSEEQPPKELIDKYEKTYGNPGVGGPMSNTEIKTWYQLLRNAQGTLKPYFTGKIKHMINSKDFIGDSLFCEWGYVVNLDDGVFEVYEGFQKEAHNDGRYARMKAYTPDYDKSTTYYPCRMIISFPLEDLPDPETFLAKIKELTGGDDE